MRVRSVLSTVVVAVLAVTIAGPAAPAAANPVPLQRCYESATPQYQDPSPRFAAGNSYTNHGSPYGILPEDVFRATANGSLRIDYWGTTKSIAGELPVAPAGWPAPGVRRYMLIARVTTGSVWLANTGYTYGPHQWFPVGTDSGCFVFLPPGGGSNPQLQFSFNDPTLHDNGGGAWVTLSQWWG